MKKHFGFQLMSFSTLIILTIGFYSCKKEINYPLPSITTNNILVFSSYSAIVGGNVTSDGGAAVSENGVYYGTSPNPEKTGVMVQISTGTGIYNKNIIELIPNTLYYIKAYATNSRGTAFGEEKSFTTSIALAALTTNEVTGFISSSAIGGGNITFDGNSPITARGVCWDTNINPTIALATRTVDGSGTGSFISNMTGLQPGINYYVRAYATNKAGTVYGPLQTFTKPTSAIEVVLVQGGTFQMGSAFGSYDEQRIHDVTVSDFYIGKYEVTQDQWNAIMGNIPSLFWGVNFPVDQVSWADVQKFIGKLNTATGKAYRLPTEAEWEFAAKGGLNSKGFLFSGGNNMDNLGWSKTNCFNSSGDFSVHPVGGKQPNELGLYDMSGNVYELCNDWYEYNYNTSPNQTDPKGPLTGYYQVMRGGSIKESQIDCRTTARRNTQLSFTYSLIGFRLAISR